MQTFSLSAILATTWALRIPPPSVIFPPQSTVWIWLVQYYLESGFYCWFDLANLILESLHEALPQLCASSELAGYPHPPPPCCSFSLLSSLYWERFSCSSSISDCESLSKTLGRVINHHVHKDNNACCFYWIFVVIVSEIFCSRNSDSCACSWFEVFNYWKYHYLVFSDPK